MRTEHLLDTMEYITNISNYVRKSGSSYEDFGLSSDYHELRTYLEAEIVTLFPDVRERDDIKSKKPLEEGELQGCVQFWRKHEDGSKELMEYTPYDEFAEELKELGYDLYTDRFTPIPNATEDYILKKYYKVRDKYTLDENFNIIIPTFSSKKTEVFPSQWYEDEGGINGDGTQPSYIYTIDTKKIDYQTRIVKDRYYFPFEMGVAMLLTTRNPGFCDALAELVKDSEIIIDIQDDLVKEINTRTFNYTANYKIEVTYNVLPPNTSYSPYQWSTTGTYEAEVKPYVTIVETTTTITTKMVFQRVDSWLFHYLYDYVYEPSDPIINEYTSTPYDDADYRGVYNKNENPHRIPIPPCTEPGKNSLDSFYIYEKKTGQYWEYKDERIEAKYIEIEANREGRFAAERFLTLLRVDPTRINEKTGKPEYNLYDRDKNIVIVKHKNKDNFLSSPMDALMGANLETLIYRYLEKNEKTEGFAQIINHLMAIFLGQEEYDPEMFVEYDPGEFDPITGGGRRRPAVDHILVILWKKKYGGH